MRPPLLEALLIIYARRFPLRRGKLRVVNALWRAAAKRGGTHRTARLLYGGFDIPCDLSEMLQRQFYFFGTYFLEEGILQRWSELAVSSRIIFDVGANAGIYSLAAMAANAQADVHAFEPTFEIAARLRATRDINELCRLNVHEMAISDKTGRATLVRYRGGDQSNEGMNFIVDDQHDGRESVPTDSLERFCDEHGLDHIDLLKMDIQGHEYAALRGAGALLDEGRIGYLFLELNWGPEGSDDCPATACIRHLEERGYRFSRPVGKSEWRSAGDWMRGMSDVIAHRPTLA